VARVVRNAPPRVQVLRCLFQKKNPRTSTLQLQPKSKKRTIRGGALGITRAWGTGLSSLSFRAFALGIGAIARPSIGERIGQARTGIITTGDLPLDVRITNLAARISGTTITAKCQHIIDQLSGTSWNGASFATYLPAFEAVAVSLVVSDMTDQVDPRYNRVYELCGKRLIVREALLHDGTHVRT
jgi:hypothetical protein